MEVNSKIWHFENFNIIKYLTENEKQGVMILSTMKQLQRKQIIYLAGDSSDNIYFLKAGKVKISKYSEEGKEMIVSILGTGQIFGELSMTTQDNRGEVAEVIKDCLLCSIKADDLNKIIAENPHFPLQVVKLVGEKVKRVEKRLESLYFKTVSQRINEFILDLAADNGIDISFDLHKEIKVDLFLTHEEIAKLTATNRQTVTSILKDLDKQNIISYSRKVIIIKDIQALKNGVYS
jgi:CRP-like cAMP-binding protein